MIYRNWVIAAMTQKSDALRSPRTAATKAPRLIAPGQLSSAQTYNPFGRSQSANPRWHSSPLVSESRNPPRGWTRFRGPVSPATNLDAGKRTVWDLAALQLSSIDGQGCRPVAVHRKDVL